MTRLLAILCAALLLPMTDCENSVQYDAFDAGTEGIVDVVTDASVLQGIEPFDGEQAERYYYTVASSQRIQPAKPFEPEAMTVYTVPESCFGHPNGQWQPRTQAQWASAEILDEQGNSLPAGETIGKLLSRLEALHQDFFRVRIFEINGEYFPYVELNVNLWDPCRLYHYDQEEDALVELYTFDAEEVVGLRLRNPDLL